MAPKKETGVCMLCGNETGGTVAKPDYIVLFFRKARALFRQPEKHTVACGSCLGESRKRRAAFETRRKSYRIYAVLFFLFVVAGSALFGAPLLPMALPATAGSLFILALPYAYYFPDF